MFVYLYNSYIKQVTVKKKTYINKDIYNTSNIPLSNHFTILLSYLFGPMPPIRKRVKDIEYNQT